MHFLTSLPSDQGIGRWWCTGLISGLAACATEDYNSDGFDLEPILLHWDGSSWKLVRVPIDALAWYAVTALGPDDLWVTGYAAAQTDNVIMHWDGRAWSTTVVSAYIDTLDALSPDDAWAAGTTLDTHRGVIEHWNGETWAVVPSPSPVGQTWMQSINAVSASDVWAVGGNGCPGTDAGDTVIEHWDGNKWSLIPSPSPGSHWSFLGDVSADSATDTQQWGLGEVRTLRATL